ncbi:MAG: PilZN3 domain-containing protein [Spirochaetia bacterium]
MAKSIIQEYIERYSEKAIAFNNYAIKKTGLIQNQTVIKLEDYMLIGAPYQLSMKRAIMLVILSKEESAFFKRFQGKMCSLSIVFQPGDRPQPIKFFIRATLGKVGPVKGRDNVSLFELQLKNTPNELIEIIGKHLGFMDALESQYESLQGKEVPITPETMKILRYNTFMEAVFSKKKVMPTLKSIAVNEITLGFDPQKAYPAEGDQINLKLYFQSYQFSVNGKVTERKQNSHNQVLIKVAVGFTPELVEIIDDYLFRARLRERK